MSLSGLTTLCHCPAWPLYVIVRLDRTISNLFSSPNLTLWSHHKEFRIPSLRKFRHCEEWVKRTTKQSRSRLNKWDCFGFFKASQWRILGNSRIPIYRDCPVKPDNDTEWSRRTMTQVLGILEFPSDEIPWSSRGMTKGLGNFRRDCFASLAMTEFREF